MHLKVRVPKLNKQNGIPVLIGMQKLPKVFKIPNTSLKDLVQKANEKLEIQGVPNIKNIRTNPTLTAPLHPSLSTHILLLSELSFHSEETIKLFNIKLPKMAEEPPWVSFTTWSKTKLWVIVKEFPKPKGGNLKVF